MNDYNFDIVSEAGLTQKEFAAICGVSRVTANLWMRGHAKPHMFIQDRVRMVLNDIQFSLTANQLPVTAPPGDPERSEQLAYATFGWHYPYVTA